MTSLMTIEAVQLGQTHLTVYVLDRQDDPVSKIDFVIDNIINIRVRLTDVGASGAGRHVEGSHLTTENIQRQMSGGETTVVQQQGNREVVQDVQQTLTQGEWGCFCNN